jgi:hypothetical protein
LATGLHATHPLGCKTSKINSVYTSTNISKTLSQYFYRPKMCKNLVVTFTAAAAAATGESDALAEHRSSETGLHSGAIIDYYDVRNAVSFVGPLWIQPALTLVDYDKWWIEFCVVP